MANLDIVDDVVLTCPYCHSIYTHHDKVEVFERRGEDQPGTRVVVKGASVNVDANNDMRTNPSGRRNGVSVLMWCEECMMFFKLLVIQHKGSTFVTIQDTNTRAPAFEQLRVCAECGYHESWEEPVQAHAPRNSNSDECPRCGSRLLGVE